MAKSRHRRNEKAIALLSKNIRKYREFKDLTIAELAFKLDADYSQVSRMERGQINFTISALFDIAQALDIDPVRLFDEI